MQHKYISETLFFIKCFQMQNEESKIGSKNNCNDELLKQRKYIFHKMFYIEIIISIPKD